MAGNKPTIGATMGDPAGIGGEILVKAYSAVCDSADVIIIGDPDAIRDACRISGLAYDVNVVSSPERAEFGSETLSVFEVTRSGPPSYGEMNKSNGEAANAYAEAAVRLALDSQIDAVASAPINREAFARADNGYEGEIELIASVTGTDDYSIILIEDSLRVAHVTAHVPLSGIFELITVPNLLKTIRLAAEGVRSLDIEQPRIAVAGLNPHAGMNGMLGNEESETIAPAVERAVDEGIDAVGPEPPDTVFAKGANGAFDGIVAMYHDQGHIAVKTLSFESGSAVGGASMTVGFPFPRTTVDHGTAFDIAGTGTASPSSMIEAIQLATQIAKRWE